MMVRKSIQNILLLLAAFSLLAGYILPHHHHGELTCFNWTHCRGEENQKNHCADNKSHSHDENGNSCCNLLNHSALSDPGTLKAGIKVAARTLFSHHLSHDLLNGIPLTAASGIYIPHSLFFYDFYNPSSHPGYEVLASGLRAPPVS